MHEYSLVLTLIERAEQEARSKQAKSIVRLLLRVGDCSGVEADLLVQAFEIARTDTQCSQAELTVIREPAVWTCPKCEAELDPKVSLRCIPCDAAGRLTKGADLYLEQMEIEV